MDSKCTYVNASITIDLFSYHSTCQGVCSLENRIKLYWRANPILRVPPRVLSGIRSSMRSTLYWELIKNCLYLVPKILKMIFHATTKWMWLIAQEMPADGTLCDTGDSQGDLYNTKLFIHSNS